MAKKDSLIVDGGFAPGFRDRVDGGLSHFDALIAQKMAARNRNSLASQMPDGMLHSDLVRFRPTSPDDIIPGLPGPDGRPPVPSNLMDLFMDGGGEALPPASNLAHALSGIAKAPGASAAPPARSLDGLPGGPMPSNLARKDTPQTQPPDLESLARAIGPMPSGVATQADASQPPGGSRGQLIGAMTGQTPQFRGRSEVGGEPSILAQAVEQHKAGGRDQLMNTAFGRGIERTARGGGPTNARPISMEDDRRRQALIRLRAIAPEDASRANYLERRELGSAIPMPDPERVKYAMSRLGLRKEITDPTYRTPSMEEPQNMDATLLRTPMPRVANPATAEEQAANRQRYALDQEARKSLVRKRGIARGNARQGYVPPEHLAMMMPALSLGKMQTDAYGQAQQGQFTTQMMQALMGGKLAREKMASEEKIAGMRFPANDMTPKQKALFGLATAGIEGGSMTPQSARSFVFGQDGATPNGIPSLPPVADPVAAIEKVFSDASAAGREPTVEDFAAVGVSPDMAMAWATENDPSYVGISGARGVWPFNVPGRALFPSKALQTDTKAKRAGIIKKNFGGKK